MHCGLCGDGFSKISALHFGCSTARNNGPTACANRLTIRRDVLEETVLGALRERLMDPALFKVFADAFTTEWNRLHPNLAETYRQRVAELAGVLTQDNAAAASWRRFCNWQLVPEMPNAPAMRGRWRRKSSWLRGRETTDS
jgi:hypothetical protein